MAFTDSYTAVVSQAIDRMARELPEQRAVFHDAKLRNVQNAIIIAAGLLNALELQGKQLESARIVVLGAGAGLAGDRWSLGFVAETERQVEGHLDGHLRADLVDDAQAWLGREERPEDDLDHERAHHREDDGPQQDGRAGAQAQVLLQDLPGDADANSTSTLLRRTNQPAAKMTTHQAADMSR